MKKVLCLIGVVVLFIGVLWFVNYNRPAQILFLANESIEVGIIPNAGGRVVIFKTRDGDNILKAVPKLWKKRYMPEPSMKSPDVHFMGHIMWVSPQKEWWVQQNLVENKRIRKSDWPPDPFTIYAHYQIFGQTPTNLLMVAPESPITGLEMIKSFNICSNTLTLSTTAVNRRDSEVKWGLWSNTRLSARHSVSVPISSTNDLVKFEIGYGSKDIYMPYIITNNTFIYDYRFDERDLSEKKSATKLYMNPLEREYSTVVGNSVFTKTAITEVDNVHSNHTSMELYVEFEPKEGDLMEQEFHGDYKVLQPGELMTFVEVWELENSE
jgi:hypothetical protein